MGGGDKDVSKIESLQSNKGKKSLERHRASYSMNEDGSSKLIPHSFRVDSSNSVEIVEGLQKSLADVAARARDGKETVGEVLEAKSRKDRDLTPPSVYAEAYFSKLSDDSFFSSNFDFGSQVENKRGYSNAFSDNVEDISQMHNEFFTKTENKKKYSEIAKNTSIIVPEELQSTYLAEIPLTDSKQSIQFGEWSITQQEMNKRLDKFIETFDQVHDRQIKQTNIDSGIKQLATSGSRTLQKFITLVENYPPLDRNAQDLKNVVSIILLNNGKLPNQNIHLTYTFSDHEKTLITEWMIPYITSGMKAKDRQRITTVFHGRTEYNRDRKQANYKKNTEKHN